MPRNNPKDPCGNPKVLGPAIMRRGLICSLPAPYRHHDVIEHMADIGAASPIVHGVDIQGFMTIRGFMDRAATGRLIGFNGHLTSEDLW